MTNHRLRTGIVACVLAVTTVTAGCSSSSSDTSHSNPPVTVASTTTPAPAPLLIVLTDDDGIGAPGIDELARELSKVEGITVKVVAPATDQSGKGDSVTEGEVAHQPGRTASGIEGVAVDGTPADSVNVALKVLKLKPDLVASGINKGQNVGPIAAVSGTVGAALTAARNGVPAVAGSAALTDPDYPPAAKYVVDWIVANRAAIAAGKLPTDVVVNFNTPGCTSGSIHGLVKVPTAKAIPEGVNPFATDCAATSASAKPTDDVDALVNGFAAQSPVPITTTKG